MNPKPSTPLPLAANAPSPDLPQVRKPTVAESARTSPPSAAPQGPSRLYRAAPWRLARAMASALPHRVGVGLASALAATYAALRPARRRVVVENLLPVFNGDRVAAETAARRLLREFAIKLVDLWRYESGLPTDGLFTQLTGWDHFIAASKNSRGVLFVTPHLGNWEFGAPLLTTRGIALQVITLVEPGRGFTRLRQRARLLRGVDTLVIGKDPFAFVEVIRRLEGGAVVALLLDRPPVNSAVTVQLFGRPFTASIAAAELARASGCALLPVSLTRSAAGYVADILPEVDYNRTALRTREARRELTQRLLAAFEPVIREHADQWFHFVPLWNQNAPGPGS